MDHATFVDPLRRYCRDKIEPHVFADDEESRFRRELYQGLADLGVTATTTPEKYSGLGLGSLQYVWALEEIARTSVTYAVSVAVSGLVQTALVDYGNEAQKEKYLPLLVSGEWMGGFGLTETNSGSDAISLKTQAEKKGNSYILNGTKQFSTNGGEASVFIVFARTGEKEISAFLVEDSFKGFSIGKREDKMGWRSSPTTSLVFENCEVPEENLVGSLGDGFKMAMTALDAGRINISASAVGLSARALEEATRYAVERKQFGKAIIEFQGVGFMLADMQTSVEASRSFLYRVAQLKDEKQPYTHLAASLKCFATDRAMAVTTDGVQVLGGYGYTKEYPLERYMRDAKALQIVEGTNQIQRIVISRFLQRQHAEV